MAEQRRTRSSATRKSRKKKQPPKVSRVQKPEGMSLEEWQQKLRQQFGREQAFRIRNLTDEPVFSEFAVTNPESGNTYRIQVRGRQPGENTCTCADFATNSLGTCKHIEFTLAKLERKRTARATLKSGYHPPFSEVYLHYGLSREVRFRVGTDCPTEIASLVANYFDDQQTLRPEMISRFDEFLQGISESEHEVRCAPDVRGFIAELLDAERRREKIDEAFPRGIRSGAFKDLLNVPLYDYQREGALFAARAGRALIADEMGLGKTIQAIAAAEIMARLYGIERVLIICPTSLKHQWATEIEKFSGRKAQVINGERRERHQAFAEEGAFFKVLNYDTVYADQDAIEKWSPDLVVLDEAQRIKNWATRVARSVKRIQSPYAIVLTGTPLENRLEELISIVQFVDRFRLGPTFRLLDRHQIRDPFGKVTGYQNLDAIGKTLEPILIRRKKAQVLDQLPERVETNIFVPMTQLQTDLHSEQRDIVARVVERWKRLKFLSEADKQKLMIALQRMRMVCDSSYLLDPNTEQGQKPHEIEMLLGELLEQPGSKVVVFSQWLRMHELLVRRLEERKWGYVLFHGGVPGTKRKALIDRFRDDPDCRLFLSTDAGGVGLNLQFASGVMNVDLPWNPAVLEQRIGRVHRLGQKGSVRVINFVARGSIEEGMLSVLKFKKSLFSGVLDEGAKDVFMGGSRLTKFMESVEATTQAIPTQIPEVFTEPDEKEEPRPRSKKKAESLPEAASTSESREAAPPRGDDPWSGLLQAGLALLQQATQKRTESGGDSPLIRADAKTGERYLHLPVPEPAVLEQLLGGVQALLKAFQKPGA